MVLNIATLEQVSGDEPRTIENMYAPVWSADGRFMAYVGQGYDYGEYIPVPFTNVYLYDHLTDETIQLSQAADGEFEGRANSPSISADGRFVAYAGYDSALFPGDTNEAHDIFLMDLQTGETRIITRTVDGGPTRGGSTDPELSADGRFVLFWSYDKDLVENDANGYRADIFVHDTMLGTTTGITTGSNGDSWFSSMSPDGRYIVFESTSSDLVAGDDNGVRDIFLHDRLTGETKLVSVNEDGVEGDSGSGMTDVSADGRYVVFASLSTNLVPEETNYSHDVFLRDMLTGEIHLISENIDGTPGDSGSFSPTISDDGRFVVFNSRASNLVPGDTNGKIDVFLYDVVADAITRVSVDRDGRQLDDHSEGRISRDGSYIVIETRADMGIDPYGDDVFRISLRPTDGDDHLIGSTGADTIEGGQGDDRLAGGAGVDRLVGGEGDDTYVLAADDLRGPGVPLDRIVETADGGHDTVEGAESLSLVGLSGIEALHLTGSGDANGIGSPEDDSLAGNAGANVLFGRQGDDLLAGGDGADRLIGGDGQDRFVFASVGDSPAAGNDMIVDFDPRSGDRIDLAGIDADTGTAGDDAFAFIGAAGFGGRAGELRADANGPLTWIEGDVDGDGVADLRIGLLGPLAPAESDLLL